MSSSYAVLEPGWAYAMSSLHAVLELEMHMPCPHYMQFLSLGHICHALITCSSGACVVYAMPPLHAVLEYTRHMTCHHLMQFRSLWYICHVPGYCFVLLYVTLCYLVLLCIVLHSKPYRSYRPYTLWPLRHALCHHYIWFWSLDEHMLQPSYMQFCSLRGICHAIVTCSFWACGTYGMSSLHAILELMGHMPYHHYMQVSSKQGTCHAIIVAISELVMHMPWPRLLLCIALYYFVLSYITSYYITL